MLETKILQLREKQLAAEIVEVETQTDTVGFGSRVEVRDDRGRTRVYTLVAVTEANASEGRLSVESPVGRALRGARRGETVAVPRRAASAGSRSSPSARACPFAAPPVNAA